MSDLLDQLETWGCNTREALFNVMGDTDFYLSLLKRFLKDPSVTDLREAVEQGDLPAAVQASHQIKGTTATLGLDPLREEVSHFLDTIRDVDYGADQLQATYKPVEKQLETCYSIIKGEDNWRIIGDGSN